MARRSILLALAVAIVIAVPGCESTEAERQRASLAASQAFAQRAPNGGCVSGADIDFAMDVVDQQVGAAPADAGWIEEGWLFVGSLEGLAASVNASFVARAGHEAWVLAERDGPRLLRLLERGSLLKRAFLVVETQGPC